MSSRIFRGRTVCCRIKKPNLTLFDQTKTNIFFLAANCPTAKCPTAKNPLTR